MHIWTIQKWKKHLDYDAYPYKTGLRLYFDKSVDPEVKRACKEFCQWLKNEYCFPVRVSVCMKKSYNVKMQTTDEHVSAVCFLPFDKTEEPRIRVAAGDYYDMLKKRGQDNALASILHSIAHELTHYFQWINGIKLTEIGKERQATSYARFLLHEYSETRVHP